MGSAIAAMSNNPLIEKIRENTAPIIPKIIFRIKPAIINAPTTIAIFLKSSIVLTGIGVKDIDYTALFGERFYTTQALFVLQTKTYLRFFYLSFTGKNDVLLS